MRNPLAHTLLLSWHLIDHGIIHQFSIHHFYHIYHCQQRIKGQRYSHCHIILPKFHEPNQGKITLLLCTHTLYTHSGCFVIRLYITYDKIPYKYSVSNLCECYVIWCRIYSLYSNANQISSSIYFCCMAEGRIVAFKLTETKHAAKFPSNCIWFRITHRKFTNMTKMWIRLIWKSMFRDRFLWKWWWIVWSVFWLVN